MIAASLRGGLGNQMFEYAAGRSMALSQQTTLVLDLSELRRSSTPREFELGSFQIHARVTRGIRSRGLYPRQRSLRGQFGLLRREAFARFHVLHQKGFDFQPAFFEAGDWTHLLGFWQSERYFVRHAETIRADFTFRFPGSPRVEALLSSIRDVAAVSVHVRRGDYVSTSQTLPVGYYRRAVERLPHRDDLHAFVFSDDLRWSRDHLRLELPTTYVDVATNAADDLRLMASCRHHVIANSSFSWWGAWLGEGEGSVVVAPLAWVRDHAVDTSHVIPDRWLRV